MEAQLAVLRPMGYGDLSPGKYNMTAALVIEIVLTFLFLLIMSLTLIHLISIPVTNTSVNPARSTSQAVFVGGEALGQLWLFWVAPIIGAILAGLFYKLVFAAKPETT